VTTTDFSIRKEKEELTLDQKRQKLALEANMSNIFEHKSASEEFL
jgi:hypothetical protein